MSGERASEGTLKLWRAARRRQWSQAQVAAAVERSASVVSRWFSGDASPDRESVVRLRDTLGIPVDSWSRAIEPVDLPLSA